MAHGSSSSPSAVNVRRRPPIGLVGCGAWGKFILRDLLALGCEVTVVARSERSCAAAREGGAASVVGSIGELPAVDGIVVATPTATHAAVVEETLDRSVPVFVEKPLTNDPADADRLAAAAADRLFVMDKWRYHPGVELLGAIARERELGRVIGLRTTRVGWGNPHDVDAIWILAPHDLSIGLEILGLLPQPKTAVADAADGSATGLVGVLGDAPWLALEVSTRTIERRREITLLCDEGVAVLPDGYSDRVRVARATDPTDTTPPEPELRAISTELPLLRELRAFVEHLGGGPPPRSSAAEGAKMVRVISELRSLAGLSP
jgi:predicted dehydrogenase